LNWIKNYRVWRSKDTAITGANFASALLSLHKRLRLIPNDKTLPPMDARLRMNIAADRSEGKLDAETGKKG